MLPRRLLPPTLLYRQSTPGIATVHASDLTPESFERDFVSRNRPVLIKGGAAHFRACDRWTLDYVLDHCRLDRKAARHTAPLPREWGAFSDPERSLALRRRCTVTQPLADAIQHLQSGDRYTVLRELLWPGASDDLGSFPFLRSRPGSRDLLFPSYVAYLYRNCCTDWHYHPGSEALMNQIRGTKEVLLLDPLDATWRALTPFLNSALWSWMGAESKFPEIRSLTPTLVKVEAGDSLYIPIWWWHIVEAVDSDFGITVPHWWDARARQVLHPRFPGSSHALWWELPKDLASRRAWRREPGRHLRRLRFALTAWATIGLPHWLVGRVYYARKGASPGRRP